jgi:hypothetical protein
MAGAARLVHREDLVPDRSFVALARDFGELRHLRLKAIGAFLEFRRVAENSRRGLTLDVFGRRREAVPRHVRERVEEADVPRDGLRIVLRLALRHRANGVEIFALERHRRLTLFDEHVGLHLRVRRERTHGSRHDDRDERQKFFAHRYSPETRRRPLMLQQVSHRHYSSGRGLGGRTPVIRFRVT